MRRLKDYRQGIVAGVTGGVVAVMLMWSLPAIASTVGDPFELGVTNVLHNQSTTLRGLGNQPNLIVRNQGAGPALELITDSSAAPFKVTSGKKVSTLNADRIDSRHASQFIRAAYAETTQFDENELSGGTATVLTTSITAPKQGLLIMGASIDAYGQPFDAYYCSIHVDGVEVPASVRWSTVHNATPGDATKNADENCSTDAVKFVTQGSHTVDFDITSVTTTGFDAATLWVIWVGFDGQGKIPQP